MKLLIINGPNMNLLSIREPSIYGNRSYDELIEYISTERGAEHELDFVQTNNEGTIIDELHRAYYENYDGVVINPAGYSHTSIAIMDAVKAIPLPVAEVHISNPTEREDFRRIDYVALAAAAVIKGKGFEGYIEAIDCIANISRTQLLYSYCVAAENSSNNTVKQN